MNSEYEIAVIKTNEDGTRQAVVLEDDPRYSTPVKRKAHELGKPLGAPFMYSYLRNTRRSTAPPYFQFRLISEEEGLREWAEGLFG